MVAKHLADSARPCPPAGAPIANQKSQLRRGIDIAVGTPGRIIDLIENGQALDLSKIRCRPFAAALRWSSHSLPGGVAAVGVTLVQESSCFTTSADALILLMPC